MAEDDIHSQVSAYYSRKLADHGATPKGVDWNSAETQALRFSQLEGAIDRTQPFSILDFGCGYGALLDFLLNRRSEFEYVGFDIAEPMIETARQRHAANERHWFTTDESTLAACDYTLASGIFNVKMDVSAATWEPYVLGTLDRLADLSSRAFAFNALTSYSDPPKMRPDLYYADPCFLFDFCKRRYSRHVSLMHDYGLWEFTMIVRKQID